MIESRRLSLIRRPVSMREVALARMWHLPDGTSCLLLKDPRAQAWEIRVTRGNVVLRTE